MLDREQRSGGEHEADGGARFPNSLLSSPTAAVAVLPPAAAAQARAALGEGERKRYIWVRLWRERKMHGRFGSFVGARFLTQKHCTQPKMGLSRHMPTLLENGDSLTRAAAGIVGATHC